MQGKLIVLLCVATLTGCSSFKLGAFCYAPAAGGQCAATASPAPEPALTPSTPGAQ